MFFHVRKFIRFYKFNLVGFFIIRPLLVVTGCSSLDTFVPDFLLLFAVPNLCSLVLISSPTRGLEFEQSCPLVVWSISGCPPSSSSLTGFRCIQLHRTSPPSGVLITYHLGLFDSSMTFPGVQVFLRG